MIDPDSFGTALWTVLIVAGVVIAFGLAALADMAMRRREDRAARAARSANPAAARADGRERVNGSGPAGGGGSRA
ncbi:histidine kinase [Nocardiopsis sp. HUAS JQ3]|uniref:histidine kinase n=1 Tax=Nocardiopsis sp. HUAS JQ3 TaxID=3061629 RepID=UPI0023A936F8|nr:histidine kinase [Nocardiopsis sp. HUAS JQ3]WDZ88598.1 histidine kinase [Nocardiopsis sp. HUAS JQ3]